MKESKSIIDTINGLQVILLLSVQCQILFFSIIFFFQWLQKAFKKPKKTKFLSSIDQNPNKIFISTFDNEST